jgi:hypothetical protein
LVLAALAMLWPGAPRAAKVLLIERPQQNLTNTQTDYLFDLQEELVEKLEEAEFQRVDERRTNLFELIKEDAENYFIRAKLTIHPQGIKIKLFVLKAEADRATSEVREEKVWSYPIVLGTQDIEHHVSKIHGALGGHFIPSLKFYMSSAGETRLLANCIWAEDPTNQANAELSKFATLHYSELLDISALAQQYRIKGIERSEYNYVCAGSRDFEHPHARAYDHVVWGFLTYGRSQQSVVLLWQQNDGGRPKKQVDITLIGQDMSDVTDEISRHVMELAP